MPSLKKYKFLFVVGSQDLYGEEVLRTVDEHAKQMVGGSTPTRPFPARWCSTPWCAIPTKSTRR